MELTEFLDKNIIRTSLSADNKWDAIKKMSDLLMENGYLSDAKTFYEDVLEREKQGETGIGNYIAIPHGQSDSVKKTTLAICKLDKEIEWETLDGKGVKVILLFAVQNDVDFAKTHLLLLSQVARKLAKSEVVDSLLNAQTSEDVINCFK